MPNKVLALVTKKRLFYTRLVPDDGARANVCNIIILARHIAPGLDEIIDVEYRYPFSCVPSAPSYRATIMYCAKTFRYLCPSNMLIFRGHVCPRISLSLLFNRVILDGYNDEYESRLDGRFSVI